MKAKFRRKRREIKDRLTTLEFDERKDNLEEKENSYERELERKKKEKRETIGNILKERGIIQNNIYLYII